MRKIALLSLCVLFLAGVAGAQKKFKPWAEWNEKDAQKILDDSPWAHTQTETDTSEMFYNPNSPQVNNQSRNERGSVNQATNVNFRIRFLSSKPVRAAFAKTLGAKQPNLSDGLRAFVDREFPDHIVVSVTFDSADRRFEGPVMQTFNSVNLGVLQNATFLETKNGKRNFIIQYQIPSQDGLGAKFIFPRNVDGEPFLTPQSGELRFYSEMSKNLKLNMRFKVADMMYEGKLEY
jgi:hypothetical protein